MSEVLADASTIPSVSTVMIAGKTPVQTTTSELFGGKKVVVFALPGAYTPTCSSSHVPRFEELYDTFKRECGIDEIYCMSVNDGFVMNHWRDHLGVTKIKMLPDGNGEIAKALGILVPKLDLGFGHRARRSSFYIVDNKLVKSFVEADVAGDPFDVSDADTMIKFIKPDVKLPKRIVVFGLHSCGVCQKAEEYLKEKGMSYKFIHLTDGNKLSILGALQKDYKTTPLIFVEGQCVGGFSEFKKMFP